MHLGMDRIKNRVNDVNVLDVNQKASKNLISTSDKATKKNETRLIEIRNEH